MPRKKKAKRPRKPAVVDWKMARELYEEQGWSFVRIAEHFGCHRETVSTHARREKWIDAAELRQRAGTARNEKIFRDFVDQDSKAVKANLAEKHRANRRILAHVHKKLDEIDEPVSTEESVQVLKALKDQKVDPERALELVARLLAGGTSLELRRLALTVGSIEGVDSRIAGLSDDGWRSGAGGSEGDSIAASREVRRALDELGDN